MEIKIKAINKLHQSKVNKAVEWIIKYNSLNDLRNLAYDMDDEKIVRQYDRKCENAFDKYLTIVYELPKRERYQIEKSKYY